MKITFKVLFLIIALNSYSQGNVFLGQYFNLMPVFAPALTGANDFLDIRTGSRYQWLSYEGAPKTYYLSGSSSIYLGKNNPYKYNSVRVSNMGPYQARSIKIGVGGYLLNDNYGAMTQLEGVGSVAVHVTISPSTYLSLGVATGIYHTRLDLDNLLVLKPQNDATYQEYMANGARSNYLKINSGLALHSRRYYVSYSMINAGMVHLSANTYFNEFAPDLSHNLMAGLILSGGTKIELIPNLFIRYRSNLPFAFDVGMRARYNQNLYAGLSIRNDQSFIGLFGFAVNDKFNFGYSYEYKALGEGKLNSSSHEIVVSLRLFNHGKFVPIW